ncbi:hypothetical protein POSPLADRAFT_1047984 [Postia placenta MAD-698-R-SB12]|uniref:Tubulin-specific chaperone D C-terminal domain-containing protein n=1 Tax=Postia placenta MAD-698-R-SB12 TaxID=670580 RepID=A0A1X6MWJ3_9APHY|nr:hypothetical protein POSPLADRAFT_1047984 [Postia placenta MAD-698-R-SB12]OSX60573.1 hypothetical protein POSPLADRAFT_1047984 [Postia placenta MAD-698-R-SB12]
MDNRDSSPLQTTLAKLRIPAEFARYSAIAETEPETILRLERWKTQVLDVLSDLQAQLAQGQSLLLSEKAEVVSTIAPWDGVASWTLDSTREIVQSILHLYEDSDPPLLEQILSTHVKPIFQANAHPSLNPSTGRILPRSAGGPSARLDYMEGQTWKSHPGTVYLVTWCVRHCTSAAYEKLWHLIIPPVMTLLDDYEAAYKLHGVQIVSDMLRAVPADLLRRTGVDGLLFTSLTTCLTYLHNPETPSLIRAAVPAAVSLVLLTAPAGSEKRFNQLCEILGEGIIGSIWVYATRESEAIEASVDTLPTVVRALDVGAVRYLKALVPQLVFPLQPASGNVATKRFQLSSLHALAAVIEVCAPRIHRWKGAILDGVLRLWVTLADTGVDDDDTRELKHACMGVCDCLLKACPAVANLEYARLLDVDKMMFGPLVRQSGKGD